MEKYEKLVQNIKEIIEKINKEYEDTEISFIDNLNNWEGYLGLKKDGIIASVTLYLEHIVDCTNEKLEDYLKGTINMLLIQLNNALLEG